MVRANKNIRNPHMVATSRTRNIIIAKLQAEKYARSDCIGASMLAESYAKSASEQEEELPGWFFSMCPWYYDRDRHGNYVRMEQIEVTEVVSKEELNARLSSCINYTNEFMRVHNAKRTLTFQ